MSHAKPSILAQSSSLFQFGFFPHHSGVTAAPCLKAPLYWEPEAASGLGKVCLWWSHPVLAPPHPLHCCCCGSSPSGRDSVLLECDTREARQHLGAHWQQERLGCGGAWMLPRVPRPQEGWLSGISFLMAEGIHRPASCFLLLASLLLEGLFCCC